MPKSSQEQIEHDEKKVIKILQTNADTSIDNIAKKSGFSRQKVWRIKKRLEENKTIWGYCAITDDAKLGLERYIMLFKSSTQPVKGSIKKVIDLSVQKRGEGIGVDIISGGYLHGKYDWAVVFTAKNIKVATKLKEILLTEYPKMIGEIELMEYIFPLKESRLENPDIDKIREFF